MSKVTEILIKALEDAFAWNVDDGMSIFESFDYDRRRAILESLLVLANPKTLTFAYAPGFATSDHPPYDSYPVIRKIEAIKAVRSFTNWGLKESKDFVESVNSDVQSRPMPFAVSVRPEYTALMFATDLRGTGYKVY